jgi:hypothetical protein
MRPACSQISKLSAAHGGRARTEEPCSGWQKKHRLLDASLHSLRQEMRPVSRTPIRPVSQLCSASLIIVRQKSADSSRFMILDSPRYGITVTSVAVTSALRRRVQGEGPEELHPSPQEFHGASRLDSKGKRVRLRRLPLTANFAVRAEISSAPKRRRRVAPTCSKAAIRGIMARKTKIVRRMAARPHAAAKSRSPHALHSRRRLFMHATASNRRRNGLRGRQPA